MNASAPAIPSPAEREARGESNLPLIVAAVLAVLAHAAMLPLLVIEVSADRPGATMLPRVDVPQAPPPEAPPPEEEPAFGREDSKVSSVAWIDYQSFEELLARQVTTEQPALQQQVDPVEQAPPELDATPPAPTAPPEPPTPPSPADMARLDEPLPVPPAALAAKQPLPLPDLRAEAETPFAEVVASPEEARPLEEDGPAVEPSPTPARASAAATPQEARPTSSPRSDREAPPTTVETDSLRIEPGQVLAARGIEIKTVAPRFSIPARFTTPVNPHAVITFDRTGQVVDATLLRSSGYANVDGPVLASLYQWRATGERFENLTGTLRVHVDILLRSE